MSVKILVMVLSYKMSPFDSLMQTQRETWDSIGEEDVNTLYYYGGGRYSMEHKVIRQSHKRFSHDMILPCGDKYFYMAEKMKLALEAIIKWDYDLIFRTNSSSYISKEKLVEFAKTLPTEKLYAGWNVFDSNSEDKGMAVSGAGIWLSRDTAEILRDHIDPNFEMEEDIYCGRILRDKGIVPIDDKSRFDVSSKHQEIPLDRYHYRFKTDDRLRDCENMKFLHNKIIFQ